MITREHNIFPAVDPAAYAQVAEPAQPPAALPFPPLRKQHVLNCAFNSWYTKYKAVTPKARLISLPQAFMDYLQADGIFLPSDPPPAPEDEDQEDVAQDWRPLHEQIKATIKELGGKVVPKLNWSSPKDATHMLSNSMDCYNADDIYLLLKSSDFITFDLDHAFDETVDDGTAPQIPWHLVLRKSFPLIPSLEFRCFVRNRRVVAISQRDMNYYDFLFQQKDHLVDLIEDFFEENLQNTFEDEDFVFDVYIQQPADKVWLVDINPFASRTDPLLFSWLEILRIEAPTRQQELEAATVRLSLNGAHTNGINGDSAPPLHDTTGAQDDANEESDEEEIDLFTPELRLVGRDDPEARSFASPQYSAHKMPKDVVDAASFGDEGALKEFSEQWKELLDKARKADEEFESEDEGETAS